MKLLFENWRQYQLLTEAQDIGVLYESGQITEGEFLDRIKHFAKKKGIPIKLKISDFKKEIFGPGSYSDEEFEKDQAAEKGAKEAKTASYVTLQDLQDYPLSQAPREAKQGFLWVAPENIPDSADLGPNSPYGNAGEYRQEIADMSGELLQKRLVGKDSGAIFGSGDSPYFVEYEQSEDGRNILPLEWSLGYEAAMNIYTAQNR